MTTANKSIQEVLISDSQIEQLLDRLDQIEDQRGVPDVRRQPRKRYRTRRVIVHLVDRQGHELASYRVPTRNLSAGGIGFLHKWMLGQGTLLKVVLPVTAGELALDAVVVHCRHIKGMIHEVGARFTSPVNQAQ